jgi:iron(III) transport system ATP-binding protein
VAGFIGTSNFLDAEVDTIDPPQGGNLLIEQSHQCRKSLSGRYRGKVILAVRPEHCKFGESGLGGTIALATFLGDFATYEVLLDGGRTIEVNEYSSDAVLLRQRGERVHVQIDADAACVYDAGTQEVMR